MVLPTDISAIASQALVRQLGCRTREGVFRESAERNRWRDYLGAWASVDAAISPPSGGRNPETIQKRGSRRSKMQAALRIAGISSNRTSGQHQSLRTLVAFAAP